ncbi:MAG TPA: hypothetical protein VF198_18075 [Vicinamibacterales bacterium]
MTPEITRLLELWRASTFRDFPGAQLELRVPFSDAVLNQIAAAVAARHERYVRSIGIAVGASNRIDVRVAIAQPRWLPPFTVPLFLHPELAFDPGPTVVAEVASGLAGSAAQLAGTLGLPLPRGVILSGRQVLVWLAELAPEGDARVFTSWIRSGHFETLPGVLWLTLQLSAP